MVQGVPYVHWKIKDAVDLTEIDPVYLWGTVVETDKGPLDTPVFITNADQAKKIFNFNLEPFFANGGRAAVVVRAYGGQPTYSSFKFALDQPFSYAYVDYDYYYDDAIKATVIVKDSDSERPKPIPKHMYRFVSYNNENKTTQYGTGIAQETGVVSGDYTQIVVLENDADTQTQKFTGKKYFVKSDAEKDGNTAYQLYTDAGTTGEDIYVTISKLSETLNVAFSEGRWRVCDENGDIIHYYYDGDENNQTIKTAVGITTNGITKYYREGVNPSTASDDNVVENTFTKAFNESDVTKTIIAKIATVPIGAEVLEVKADYPGDFAIPISIQKDIRSGYRVSIKESDDYTIMISGATTLDYIVKRINERASNITAQLTSEGEMVQKPFSSVLVTATDAQNEALPELAEDGSNLSAYTDAAIARGLPVGTIFAKPNAINYEFKLAETVTYLADGSNGAWDSNLHRIIESERQQAHKDALDHLAKIKLSGIFCLYGEDKVQKVYADHVSTTEPQGMNSAEVCKWRTLIVGANALDRTNDYGTPGFKLIDKSAAFDNENILFLGQGLIDSGYVPEANVQLLTDDHDNPILNAAGQRQYIPLLGEDEAALPGQLLPFQCTQYVAGLRSKLFYGDAIFGGEAKKEIVGIGPDFGIAPLFAGENKVLWQPDNYATLNQAGVLTFTDDYNLPVAIMDGVTTRQSPLEEDEEGVQSIIKYAKHAVHEVLQTYIGRNITGDLESMMNSAVTAVLNAMQKENTLTDIPQDGISAFDVDIVLVPKTNAQQTLAKAYVYLKMVPVHALRQIEVELTVQ